MSSERPSFPGLYDPHFELNSNYLLPTAPNGQYLVNAGDIYLFTLYWTLILYAPLFLITGACAALFLALDPLRRIRTSVVPASNSVRSQNKFINAPRRRSIAYGAVVFLIYIVVGTALTVIGSTVVGFLIAGVYEAGGFKVSTWVPFVWALLQTLVALTRFAPHLCPMLFVLLNYHAQHVLIDHRIYIIRHELVWFRFCLSRHRHP